MLLYARAARRGSLGTAADGEAAGLRRPLPESGRERDCRERRGRYSVGGAHEGAPRRLGHHRRSLARSDRLRVAHGRHAGPGQVRRLADLSSRQRRRRSSHADHARDARRRVDLVGAQARAAVRLSRLEDAAVGAPSASAQRRQEQTLEAQESNRHPLLSAYGVSAGGARQFFGPTRRAAARRRRDHGPPDDDRALQPRARLGRRPGLRRRQARLAQRAVPA